MGGCTGHIGILSQPVTWCSRTQNDENDSRPSAQANVWGFGRFPGYVAGSLLAFILHERAKVPAAERLGTRWLASAAVVGLLALFALVDVTDVTKGKWGGPNVPWHLWLIYQPTMFVYAMLLIGLAEGCDAVAGSRAILLARSSSVSPKSRHRLARLVNVWQCATRSFP